ncbi:hypothetical protein PABG_03892 [Paracoccidioides brasiliensis Pb03]|nr:hypothetical protein PABG_03892 [Paracoccidioides brasiliensis Pb03]
MSGNKNCAEYQQSENGMLRNGMYTCPSAHLLYPPDPTGKRPSQHTFLQYASPTDRRYYEDLRLTQQQQYNDANPSRKTSHPVREKGERSVELLSEPAVQFNSRLKLQTRERRVTETSTGEAHDKISENRESLRELRSPRRRFTRIWTCCHSCVLPGPYSSFYSQCLGCDAPKCPNCIEVLVPLQESPIREHSLIQSILKATEFFLTWRGKAWEFDLCRSNSQVSLSQVPSAEPCLQGHKP